MLPDCAREIHLYSESVNIPTSGNIMTGDDLTCFVDVTVNLYGLDLAMYGL